MLNFIRTGAFGPVTLGLPRSQVRALLGEPDDWSAEARNDDSAAIWKYGTTEFHFYADRLWLIHSDEFHTPHGGPQLELDPWELRRELTVPDLKCALETANIPYVCKPDPGNAGGVAILAGAGVRFLFAESDTPGSGGLLSFSLKLDE